MDAEAFVRNAIDAALRAVPVVEEPAIGSIGFSVIGSILPGAYEQNYLDQYRELPASHSGSGPLLHL